MAVTLVEVEGRYATALQMAHAGGGEGIASFIAWASDSTTELESDASDFVDDVFLALAQGMWDSVRTDPDHPLFRVARRNLARWKGEHSSALSQLTGLELEPAPEDMNSAKEVVTAYVLEVAQFVRDVCFDETHLGSRSLQQVEDMALMLGCVDELVAGLALFRHNYMSQAGAHARTVLETVELLEFFEVKPESRSDWRSKKPGAVPCAGMRPWEIRQAIGKSSRNLYYDVLCDASSHPRNIWARSRVDFDSPESPTEEPRIAATVGAAGTRNPFMFVIAACGLVFTATLLALRLPFTTLSEATHKANARTADDLSVRSVKVLESAFADLEPAVVDGFSEVIEELRDNVTGSNGPESS